MLLERACSPYTKIYIFILCTSPRHHDRMQLQFAMWVFCPIIRVIIVWSNILYCPPPSRAYSNICRILYFLVWLFGAGDWTYNRGASGEIDLFDENDGLRYRMYVFCDHFRICDGSVPKTQTFLSSVSRPISYMLYWDLNNLFYVNVYIYI